MIQHSRCTVVLQLEWSVLQGTLCGRYSTAGIMWYLQLEWSVLQWTICGRYFTAGGQWNCSLNVVCFSEQNVEDTSQQVDSVIVAWMECVSVNIMWNIIHSRWTVVFQLECSVLQWTKCGRHFTTGGQWYCSLNGVCYSDHYVEGISQHVISRTAAWM